MTAAHHLITYTTMKGEQEKKGKRQSVFHLFTRSFALLYNLLAISYTFLHTHTHTHNCALSRAGKAHSNKQTNQPTNNNMS